MALRHAGRDNYRKMISDDIRLAAHLYGLFEKHGEFEALSRSLSITTFRYIRDMRNRSGSEEGEAYLNRLNASILTAIESGGDAFLSNAVVDGKFALRACIVNFRTRQIVRILVEACKGIPRSEIGNEPDMCPHPDISSV